MPFHDKPETTILKHLWVVLAILLVGFILSTCNPAQAAPRTLEELLEMDDTSYETAAAAAAKQGLMEYQCDCVIQNGVKIHGYPGAWSARNRRNRLDDIDININGWPE